MKIEISTKKDFADFAKPRIAEGIYLAKLKDVKDIKDGKFGPRMAFIYTVMDKASATEVELALVCYKKQANTSNGLGQILSAHGVDVEAENAPVVDTDALVGSVVRAYVEDYEYEKVDEKTQQKSKVTASAIRKVKAKDSVN